MQKMKKSLLCLLCICMLISWFAPVSFGANHEDDKTVYEAVLLIDTSESMNLADKPNNEGYRVSVEAVKAFALNCTADCDFYLSVVLYNTNVYTLIERVNVTTEEGKQIYFEKLDLLYREDKTFGENSSKFNCWSGQTNIGSALDYANNILEKSNADKKATMLFTDGQIVLGNANAEQASADLAVKISENFAEDQMPLYCVGLNKSGSVDKAFLEALSDRTGSAENPGFTSVCTQTREVLELFNKVYAYFTKNVPTVDAFDLKPNQPQTHTFEIYKDAIKEININLNADAQLEKIKITDPSGLLVMDVERSKGKFFCNTNYCRSEELGSNITHVKLSYPKGGEWAIELESKTSTRVSVSQIFVDDLTCQMQFPEKVLVGSSFDCEVEMLANKSGNRIPGGKIYEDSVCTVAVYDATGELLNTYNCNINAEKDGYVTALSLQKPGTYKIKSFIRNPGFEVESESEIEIIEPLLRLKGRGTNVTIEITDPFTMERVVKFPTYLIGENVTLNLYKDGSFYESKEIPLTSFADGIYVRDFAEQYVSGDFYCIASINGKNESNKYSFDINDPAIKMESNGNEFKIGDEISLTVTLYDAETSLPYAELPLAFEGTKVILNINKNGSAYKQESIPMSRFANGVYTYIFNSEEQGNFTCIASVSELLLSSETVALNVVNLPVEVVTQPKDIHGEIKLKETDKFEHSISLENLFSDGDGHELTYSVSVSDNDKIMVDIKGNILYLTVKDNLEGSITITADDGHGSAADVTFNMNVTVIEPVDPAVVITIVSIIVGSLLLIAVVLFIIAKKTSTIDTKFKLTITVPDPTGGDFVVEYRQAVPPTAYRGGGGKKSIAQALNGTGISIDSDAPGSRADNAIRSTNALNDIYMEGLPFHRGIKLYDDKRKSVWKKSSRKSAASIARKVGNNTIRVRIIGQ